MHYCGSVEAQGTERNEKPSDELPPHSFGYHQMETENAHSIKTERPRSSRKRSHIGRNAADLPL
jgi:hypothetical protein